MMDEMSRQYQVVEPRYLFGSQDVRGQSVFWTSMCEIAFQSPWCLLCFYAYHRNAPWRRALEFGVSLLQIAGVWWFYVPEAYSEFQHLGGWPPNAKGGHLSFENLFYFYFGFWILGSVWVVTATNIAVTAFRELAAIVAERDARAEA